MPKSIDISEVTFNFPPRQPNAIGFSTANTSQL